MSGVDADVVIVGAGPVGLAAAATVAQSGHSVLVVDQHPEGQNSSRAAVVHARTLEVLAQIGVAGPLVAAGIPGSVFAFRTSEEVLMRVDFARLPTAFPMVLFVSQAQTERLLLERVQELGVRVLRPAKAVGLVQDRDGVDLSLDDGQVVRSHYVIGADGMHSTVRELSGIGFVPYGRGGAAEAAAFVLADVTVDRADSVVEASMVVSPEGLLVIVPLPGGRCRIVAEVKDPPEAPSLGYIAELLASRGPASQSLSVISVVWSSRFRTHHLLAETFHSGRILLAGDAAHVHSPAGGQGMNLGIRDATALGQALAEVLGAAGNSRAGTAGGTAADGASGKACDAVLAAVATRRRNQARAVIAMTQRLSRMAMLPAGLQPPRNLLVHAVSGLAPVRQGVAKALSGLADR